MNQVLASRKKLLLILFCFLAFPFEAYCAGVTVYQHSNYSGAAAEYSTDISNLSGYYLGGGVPANDQISSFVIAPGYSIAVCMHANYKGVCGLFHGKASQYTQINWAQLNAIGLNDQISSIKVIPLSISGGSKLFGLPSWMDMNTMAIETYGPGINDIRWMKAIKNHFVEEMRTSLDAAGYTNIASTHKQNFVDAEGTIANWQGLLSTSEWNFFGGHGGCGGYGPTMWNGETASPDIKSFSNYNRYNLYYACMTMSRTPDYYYPAFKGLHAMLGFSSISFTFEKWNLSLAVWEYSWEIVTDFQKRWIRDNTPMWDAWVQSNALNMVDHGDHDIEVASIYPRIYIYHGSTGVGRWVNGNYERFNDIYNGPFPFETGEFHRVTVTWGSPEYCY